MEKINLQKMFILSSRNTKTEGRTQQLLKTNFSTLVQSAIVEGLLGASVWNCDWSSKTTGNQGESSNLWQISVEGKYSPYEESVAATIRMRKIKIISEDVKRRTQLESHPSEKRMLEQGKTEWEWGDSEWDKCSVHEGKRCLEAFQIVD